ncbi:MAG TPA: TlpA disulfide reductase family protein [Verrucomicrobiae bacterium]|nr:TlpA disulfide reductase family protein [Verrucomicrobiae bacterium]
MNRTFLIALIAAMLPCRFVLADGTADATQELKSLITKVRADIQAGKTTETDLSDDLKQFDALLAEHKGEKTDAVARILYMKAMIYSEVIHDSAKSDALMNQLTNEFSGTTLVTRLQNQEAQEAQAKKIQDSLAKGTQFPDFSENDVTGKPLSIANYKGKVVMIDFWATWCPPCRGEIPNVVATYQKYHDKGFEIIGVSLDSDRDKLLSFIKENNMTWQQYFDGQGWSNKLAVKYGIESIPMTFLLDGNGKIIGKDLRGEELTDAVASSLK